MALRNAPEEKPAVAAPEAAPAPAPAPAAAAPLTLAEKIRQVGEERQMDSGLVDLLLDIAAKLELLGKALGR